MLLYKEKKKYKKKLIYSIEPLSLKEDLKNKNKFSFENEVENLIVSNEKFVSKSKNLLGKKRLLEEKEEINNIMNFNSIYLMNSFEEEDVNSLDFVNINSAFNGD